MSLQRDSGRKKRKLRIDDSDVILTRNMDLCIDSGFEKVNDSQSSLEGHRDLFGELIPDVVSNADTKKELNKKAPVSKKKKQSYEDIVDTPIVRPKRVFIPTPKIMKFMKEAHKELYSIMNAKTSSSNVSVVSTDSLDVSGVQQLQDSPIISKKNESKINTEDIKNDEKSQKVLAGVVAFVDYKIDNERADSSISHRLVDLGAKVVKTFNQKVTHVMFCDGYRSTYNKAIERKIPLVSARWMEYSKLANKIQDPADYPPVGMDKYTKTPLKIFNIHKRMTYKKFLSPSSIERDQLFKKKCDNLMKQFNLSLNRSNEEGKSSTIVTPQKTTVNEQDDFYKHKDIVDKLSDQLCQVLNKVDSLIPDEQIDELNVPMSIKTLRKHLTPEGKENTTSKELYSQIAKIEEQLNLNFQARKRFRKLLFPTDEDLNNICEISDFPTQTKDGDSSIKTSNSVTFQTSNVFLEDDDIDLHSSIACTGMIKSEVKILKSSIHNLGKFAFHTKVKPSTTILIVKSKSIDQSLDIVFAISYGCYIISEDWVHESFKIGRWLSYQQYMISDLSEPITDFQIRRHTIFGSTSKFNLFNKAGKIYISDTCEPSAKILKRLVHACGGHCTNNKHTATVVVGNTPEMNNNVHEKWILDCITQGILLSHYQYKIVNAIK